MARSPRRSKYYVRVARPRIETAVVEVEAVDDEEAEQRALEQATQLSEACWAIEPFDMGAYGPHVDKMVSGDDFDPVVELDRDQATELLAETATHYLLLRADCNAGEGEVVVQPWFVVDDPDLLASDLTRDWLRSLEQLRLTYMSERLDDLASGETPKPSDRILFDTSTRRKRRDKSR
jgi:hypothetical protein